MALPSFLSSPGRSRVPIIALAFGLAAAADLQCQTVWPGAGARVRATVPCAPAGVEPGTQTAAECRFVGTLVDAGAGALTLDADGRPLSFDPGRVRRLEVSRGSRSHRTVGAVAGTVAGLGISYVVLHQGGSTSFCDRSANQDALAARECLGLVLLGGAAGAGLGAVVGGLIRSERWESVALEELRVGASVDGGFGLRVAARHRAKPRT